MYFIVLVFYRMIFEFGDATLILYCINNVVSVLVSSYVCWILHCPLPEQILHHGTTVVQWDPESGRSCLVYLRLERSNGTLTWMRPPWSGLRTSHSPPDYTLAANPEATVSPGLLLMVSTVLKVGGFMCSSDMIVSREGLVWAVRGLCLADMILSPCHYFFSWKS